MKSSIKTSVALILVVVMLPLTLMGCGEKKRNNIIMGQLEYQSIEQKASNYADEYNPFVKNNKYPENFEIKQFPSLNAMLLELNAGKIDYIGGLPKHTADYIAKLDPILKSFDDEAFKNFHMGTRINETMLCAELDSAITEIMSSGELDGLIQQYITELSGDPLPNKIIGYPDGETYVVGITGDLPPMDYVSADGSPAGFNVAMLNAIALIKGCNFEIVQIESNARLTALSSKKIDIIFWLGCWDTEGFNAKNEDVLLTQPYYNNLNGFVTKDFPIAKIKEMEGYE